MLMAVGQVHLEVSATADLALHFNGSTLQGDELMNQGQTDSASFMSAAACALDAAEALKKMCQLVLRDTSAGVVNGEKRALLLGGDGDANLSVEGGLEGVGK